MTTPAQETKLQGLMDKWGLKSALFLIALIVYIYQNEKAEMMADIKSNSAAIAELRDDKASRKELQSAIEAVIRNNDSLKQDVKEIIVTMRNDLVERIDLITKSK